MQTLEEQFNTRLNTFLGSTGLRPTTLGMQAVGDPSLLRQIERGRSPSLRTADRILAFMAAYEQDSGGARAPPGRLAGPGPATRGRKANRSRAMSGARLTAALECANDAGGRCALWPSGDARRCCGVGHDTATSCAFAAGSAGAARAALTGTGATPQSEGLVRVRTQVCLRTCPRPPGVAPDPSIPTREGGLSAASRRRITRLPTGRPSGSRASPSKAGVPPMAGAAAQAAKSGTRPSQVTVVQPQSSQRHTEPLARTSQRRFRAHAPQCRCARAVHHRPPVIGGQDPPPEPLSTRLQNNLPMIAPDS